ncbi:DUF4238 domain-containing protein [Bradyrhizobium diazoefficiens]|uniref:DUF4238 domain-containing protein n=1 Tax=Bradyrhizobium diazoefficiens TaxID=1355477 RepID=UPI0019099F73|nr:DUF4238 domain-containing protein [Bradyrhizobium diazoefficiens]MBK3665537.1 DUF4238 domain-containing protein [Bradyrhizobium diazoefficiens]
MKKRRQHHVWQRYLKPWTVDDQLYCLRDGAIFVTGTNSVGVDRDFYKLHKLTDDDLALIKMLVIDAGHPLAKRHHEDLLVHLVGPARFVEQNRHQLGNLEKIEELLDIHQTNALEDYHAMTENRFLPILDMILAGDLSFYEHAEQCITFLHFVCMQTMRTKGVKERTIDRVKFHDQKDLTRIWGIMSLMFAFNIAMSLFRERKQRKLVLLDNSTDTQFITGDQPIMNLRGDGLRPPTELCFYYPVSPRSALLLAEANKQPAFSSASLTAAQVGELNQEMRRACHSQLFGQTRDSLLLVTG